MFVYFIDSSPQVTVTKKELSVVSNAVKYHSSNAQSSFIQYHTTDTPTQAVGTFWKVSACRILRKAE
jgi:hypothetical protein